jgi:hypothetical protein
MPITRQDYMSNKATHDEYYLDVARSAGLGIGNIPKDLVEKCRTSKDPHFNDTTRILDWDTAMISYQGQINRALKERGDFWSLAGALCVGKAIVRDALSLFGNDDLDQK